MASPKPQVSCSAVSEDASVVQVLDSCEPLVASVSEESSVVQVMDSNEPLVASVSAGPSVVQVMDSNEPLVASVSADHSVVQVLDSNEPLVATSPASSESSVDDDQPRASGSSGRRVHLYSREVRSHWNMFRVLTLLNTPAQCISFAEERRLLPTQKMCTYHRRPMSLSFNSSSGPLGMYRCRKSNCRARAVTRAAGTWFDNARLSIELQFLVMYMFCQKFTYAQVKLETAREDRETVLSTRTIADWYSYCRETVIVYELEHQQHTGKIGGPGKIVQIDESKFGKRKYNRGRHIEGHWVLGMIENGKDDLRLEVCPDNDRSSEILVPLIQKHVEIGTEIHTDFWRAYDCLSQHGYIHKKVNHSDPINRFVAPDGTHTQRIESHWRNLKIMFGRDGFKGEFADWLIEYSWRRKIQIAHLDIFEELLKAIEYVYNINE